MNGAIFVVFDKSHGKACIVSIHLTHCMLFTCVCVCVCISKEVVEPGKELFKLLLLTLIAFLFGLLPFVDNFSQLGGFVFGIAA